jgi:NADH-quinone oxidoreductase subunit L
MAVTLIFLVIGLPWLGALCVWFAGNQHPKSQHGLAVGFSIAAGLASLALIAFAKAGVVVSVPFGSPFGTLTFVADGLGVFLAAIAAVIGALAVLFSVDYMKSDSQLGRYYFLVLFFIGAMVGLVLSGNLFFTFIFWEITALCSYGLISFYNDDPKAVAGGIKALIITQIGGVGLLAGALIAYAYLGSYQIADLLANAGKLPAGILSVMAFGFLVAAAAKSAQFPFHTWLPDAMEAPTPVSALIHAATMVNAGVYLLARFYPAFANVPGWTTAVMLVGLVSALIAALMALTATDLKRALAYSTVSQLGYMVYAIGAGDIFASQFHLLSHAVFKALLFLSAGSVIHAAGTRDMRRMGALGKQMPFVRTVFVIGALGLAGVPILNGFWSKELVLEAGLSGTPLWAYIAMLIGAALTAFYSFRMTWLVFYGEARESLHAHDAGPAMKISLGLLAVGTFTTWLFASGLSHLFASSLPFHGIEPESLLAIIISVAAAPATWLALFVVALGFAAFWFAGRKFALSDAPRWLAPFSDSSFGLEPVNRFVVRVVSGFAGKLRATQTGALNWNAVGIVGALLVLLIILAWSVL